MIHEIEPTEYSRVEVGSGSYIRSFSATKLGPYKTKSEFNPALGYDVLKHEKNDEDLWVVTYTHGFVYVWSAKHNKWTPTLNLDMFDFAMSKEEALKVLAEAPSLETAK